MSGLEAERKSTESLLITVDGGDIIINGAGTTSLRVLLDTWYVNNGVI